MAVSVYKTFLSGEVLTAADLNASLTQFANGGIALISPMTGALDANSQDITAIDELAFTDAATAPSASGRLRRNSQSLAWKGTTAVGLMVQATDANSSAILQLSNDAQAWQMLTQTDDSLLIRDSTTGPTTRVTIATSGTITLNGPLVGMSISGTPVAGALYRQSVVKGWTKCNYAGSADGSFNVSSITDDGTGIVTVTWDRDFADTNYAVVATSFHATNANFCTVTAQAVGSTQIVTWAVTPAAADATSLYVMAIGSQ